MAPSIRAASMISSGMDFIAAASTTIANPVWIQIMMTISRKVLIGLVSSQCGGCFHPSLMTISLSRPTCGCFGSR